MVRRENIKAVNDPERKETVLEGHHYDIHFGRHELPGVGEVHVTTVRHTTGELLGLGHKRDVTVVYYRELHTGGADKRKG